MHAVNNVVARYGKDKMISNTAENSGFHVRTTRKAAPHRSTLPVAASTMAPSPSAQHQPSPDYMDYSSEHYQFLPGPEEFDNFADPNQPSSSQAHQQPAGQNQLFPTNFDGQFSSANLNSPDLPFIIDHPLDAYVVRNEAATLTCRAVRTHHIKYKCNGQWVADGEHTVRSGTDSVTALQFHQSAIDRSRAQVQRYHGLTGYSCTCYAFGDDTDKRVVRSEPATVRIAYLRKHFYTAPASERLPLGSSVAMPCHAPEGEPKPEIFWLKENVELVRGADPNVILSHDGQLLISAARLSDSGNYTCGARNHANSRLSQPAKLVIYVDGGWSEWSRWAGDCSVNCDRLARALNDPAQIDPIPKLSRFRQCDAPAPRNGGRRCDGPAEEWKDCPLKCSLPGGWSSWSDWSTCSAECHQYRTRDCSSPPPLNGGTPCPGVNLETQSCQQAGYCKPAASSDANSAGGLSSGTSSLALLVGGPAAGVVLLLLLALALWCCCRRRTSKGKKPAKHDYYGPNLGGAAFESVLHPELTQHTLLRQDYGSEAVKHQMDYQLQQGTYSTRSGRSSQAAYERHNHRYTPGQPLGGSKAALLEQAAAVNCSGSSSGGSNGNGVNGTASSGAGSLEYACTPLHNIHSQQATPARCISRQSDENYATLYDFSHHEDNEELQLQANNERCSLMSGVDYECLTVAQVDHRGARLCLPHCGVSLTIPEEALPRGQTHEIFLAVCRDPSQRPTTSDDQTLLSPLVVCGPGSIPLRKPVVLSVPHCAMLTANGDVSTWSVSVYADDEAQSTPQWQPAVTCGEESLASCMHCQLDTRLAHVMLEQLCRVILIGVPRAEATGVKRMKLAAYAPVYPSTLDYPIRVYCVEDTLSAEQYVSEDEARLGGCLVAESQSFHMQSEGDLCCCLEDVSRGWRVKPGANYQEIPARHLWQSTGRDHLHCSFSLELTDDTYGLLANGSSSGSISGRGPTATAAPVNLAARVLVYQKGAPQHRQIIQVDTHANMKAGAQKLSNPPSRSDSAVHTVTSLHENGSGGSPRANTRQTQGATGQAGGGSCSASPSSFNSSSAGYYGGGQSFKLPLAVKRQLCVLLDRPVEMENDWRMLAKSLCPNAYIQYFGLRPSPTEHILDLWEAREQSAGAIVELEHALKMMGRLDALAICQTFVANNPVNL